MEIVAAMAHTQSLSFLPRNAHSAPFVEVRQSLPSKVAAISPFADQLMRFILNFRSADGSETDIEMALHEALANAVMHGSGETQASAFTSRAAATWTEKSQSRFGTKEKDSTAALCWIPHV
jgi:hypothetical protein